MDIKEAMTAMLDGKVVTAEGLTLRFYYFCGAFRSINLEGKDSKVDQFYDHDYYIYEEPKREFDLKPFDKVLVKCDDGQPWSLEFFERIDKSYDDEDCFSCLGSYVSQIARYEGNEDCLGRLVNIKDKWTAEDL